mmetsp:Transcript_124462/g.359870  ORF Transcript_124462/g.359870 Transcript_124462/m.359870 type:complete len:321 (+) Transcript_124462:19-981(+)
MLASASSAAWRACPRTWRSATRSCVGATGGCRHGCGRPQYGRSCCGRCRAVGGAWDFVVAIEAVAAEALGRRFRGESHWFLQRARHPREHQKDETLGGRVAPLAREAEGLALGRCGGRRFELSTSVDPCGRSEAQRHGALHTRRAPGLPEAILRSARFCRANAASSGGRCLQFGRWRWKRSLAGRRRCRHCCHISRSGVALAQRGCAASAAAKFWGLSMQAEVWCGLLAQGDAPLANRKRGAQEEAVFCAVRRRRWRRLAGHAGAAAAASAHVLLRAGGGALRRPQLCASSRFGAVRSLRPRRPARPCPGRRRWLALAKL